MEVVMQIANPIYDVVFKYLLEDKEAAKLLLSKVTGESIKDLDVLPQEHTVELKNKSLTVYRLDFSAKIKLKTGAFKQVLIEIQKAKFSTDIMRFRRYLGEQYKNDANVYLDENGDQKALPLINVYFLGKNLKYAKQPVINVKRGYYDASTGKKIKEHEEFIESLSHDSVVVQISKLKEPYKTELEKLLSVFDQKYVTSKNKHVLNIDESEYPKKYIKIIRRLQRAIAEHEVRETMDIEDDILEELGDMERLIEKKDDTIKEQGSTIEEQGKELKQKDRTLEENEKLIRELKRKLQMVSDE